LGQTCEAQRIVCCGTILIKIFTRTAKLIKCIAVISVYWEIKGNCSNRVKLNAVGLIPIFVLGSNFDVLVFRLQFQQFLCAVCFLKTITVRRFFEKEKFFLAEVPFHNYNFLF
jgi:hypothetical protein